MARREWSKGRRAQLYKITSRLLQGKPKPAIVDLITVIHAYERLATEHPDQVSYRFKLRKSIARLATILVATGKTSQASRLNSLGPFQNVSIAEGEESARKQS
jgi:hypothetical protein